MDLLLILTAFGFHSDWSDQDIGGEDLFGFHEPPPDNLTRVPPVIAPNNMCVAGNLNESLPDGLCE